MLRVGFDLTGLELDQGGGARIARGMQAALAAEGEVELVPVAQSGGGGRALRGLARELWWYPVALPRRARGLDVLHCPLPLAPAGGSTPVVMTIHDALAYEHPEWFTRANALHARTVLRRAARRAAVVHTSSEHGRERLVAALGLDPARVVVVPPGVDGRFAPGEPDRAALARLRLDGAPYVLTVGTLQPRKNLEAALAAFERLGGEHRLAIAGSRGWRDDELIARVRRSPAAERIALLGRVSDDELVALYRGAELFVFPSLAEGFGLPPLEAMACGTAVLCSDRTSLPEACGGAAELVDAVDPDALAGALERLLADPVRRAELARGGLVRAAEFSWPRCARALAGVYARAAAGS